jgi:phage gp45-like
MIKAFFAKITSVLSGNVRTVKGTGRIGESFAGAKFLQQYGFASKPLEGAEAIVFMQDGQLIIVGTDDRRYRISLEDGEAVLYSYEGTKVHLKRGKKVEVSGADEINLGGDRGALYRLIDERVAAHIDAHIHPDPVTGFTGVPTLLLTPLLGENSTDIVRAK